MKYHVYLDGKGYILADEGYIKQPLQPFSPRFSTGAPTEEDMTYWQFWLQDNFAGGMAQNIWSEDEPTRYKDSRGIDPSSPHKLSLLEKVEQIARLEPDDWKMLEYNGRLYFFGKNTGLSLSFNPADLDSTGNLPISFGKTYTSSKDWWEEKRFLGIYYGSELHTTTASIKARGIIAWAVLGDCLYLLGTTVDFLPTKSFDTVYAVGHETIYIIALRGTAQKHATGFSFAKVYEDNYLGEQARIPRLYSPTCTLLAPFGDGLIYNKKGILYHLKVNSDGSFNTDNYGTPNADQQVDIGTLSGLTLTSFAAWNQRLYLGGYDNQGRSVISWTDGQRRLESYGIEGKFKIQKMMPWYGELIYAGVRDERKGEVYIYPDKLLFSVEADDPNIDTGIYDMSVGKYLYVPWSGGTGLYAIDPKGAVYPWHFTVNPVSEKITSVEDFFGHTFFVTSAGQVFRSASGRYLNDGYLETAIYRSPLTMIDKTFQAVRIEAESPLSPGQWIKVKARFEYRGSGLTDWVDVVTLEKGQTEKEVKFSEPQICLGIQLRIELHTDNERLQVPFKKVLVRYLPQGPTQKDENGNPVGMKTWGLSIKAENRLKLLDGTYEPRTGAQISADLWEVWNAAKPVSFVDVDGKSYNVIITDIAEESPLIDPTRLESFVRVELLEA